MARKKTQVDVEEVVVIFTPYITRNGKRDYASAHGKKAWRLEIPKSKYRKKVA